MKILSFNTCPLDLASHRSKVQLARPTENIHGNTPLTGLFLQLKCDANTFAVGGCYFFFLTIVTKVQLPRNFQGKIVR